ncbi:hypothetical protein NDU88_004452 [Pleurodeles waltl]|uniref:Uncharacterized protein n=1 Tax=Pleurodeles waltl TaxID=8319 RepID=A0AAV7V308_PLEWA|nr:hypothetical protein NDU88_004452 [Pleurodeles waltl]
MLRLAFLPPRQHSQYIQIKKYLPESQICFAHLDQEKSYKEDEVKLKISLRVEGISERARGLKFPGTNQSTLYTSAK